MITCERDEWIVLLKIPNNMNEKFDNHEGPSNRWIVRTQHSFESPNKSLHSLLLRHSSHSSHSSSQKIDKQFEHPMPFSNVTRGNKYILFEEKYLAIDNRNFNDMFKKSMKFSTKRDLIYIVKIHHIQHHYNFNAIDSNTKTQVTCCSQKDK